jgi:hypothetical protein
MTPVRHHHLKAVGRAPELGRFVLGGGEAQPETYSMEKGTGLHTVLSKKQRVTFYPKARNEVHKEYQAFLERNAGALILTRSEYDHAHAMADAVNENADARFLLDGCVWEESLLFDWMGRACRTTPDARGPNRVIELKQSKTANPHPREFPRLIETMGYDTQLAFHRIGATEATLEDVDYDAFIIAVEPTPPHLVCVFEVGPRMLTRAEVTLERWMSRLLECETGGHWPGYSDGIVKVDLPEDFAAREAA